MKSKIHNWSTYCDIMSSVFNNGRGFFVIPFEFAKIRKNLNPLVNKVNGRLKVASITDFPMWVHLSPLLWPFTCSFHIAEWYFIICIFSFSPHIVKRFLSTNSNSKFQHQIKLSVLLFEFLFVTGILNWYIFTLGVSCSSY